jgi:hypothetical protein
MDKEIPKPEGRGDKRQKPPKVEEIEDQSKERE